MTRVASFFPAVQRKTESVTENGEVQENGEVAAIAPSPLPFSQSSVTDSVFLSRPESHRGLTGGGRGAIVGVSVPEPGGGPQVYRKSQERRRGCRVHKPEARRSAGTPRVDVRVFIHAVVRHPPNPCAEPALELAPPDDIAVRACEPGALEGQP